jgi:hypothetical protein
VFATRSNIFSDSFLKLAWLGTGEPDLLVSQVSFRLRTSLAWWWGRVLKIAIAPKKNRFCWFHQKLINLIKKSVQNSKSEIWFKKLINWLFFFENRSVFLVYRVVFSKIGSFPRKSKSFFLKIDVHSLCASNKRYHLLCALDNE